VANTGCYRDFKALDDLSGAENRIPPVLRHRIIFQPDPAKIPASSVGFGALGSFEQSFILLVW